jgi:unsaturated chondroitin disaccharide hydrolase
MKINSTITYESLANDLKRFWEIAELKASLIEKEYDDSQGSPVFTVNGKYSTKGWTEWTQGFQFGIPLLVFEATGNKGMLKIGKKNTIENMAHHISHFGVHDHAFNNLSTYGNLLRLGNQKEIECTEEELNFYRLAIKLSGAVQAKRWTKTIDGKGFMYSFNGPHSLFIDTMRTCRILLASYKLGHKMLDENDVEINMLRRAIEHGLTTAKYAVFYGKGRDKFDERGRVAHESIFNVNDGNYRCPNSQQGYSGFTTWTRGLSWAMLGFTEFLEFLESEKTNIEELGEVKEIFLEAAKATCDFYIKNSAADGIPYWDTGAPELHKLGDYIKVDSNPFNDYEPVDSSAAAIGAQGLLRLSALLNITSSEVAKKYEQAGLTTLRTLLSNTYLSSDRNHQGILLHANYHFPNGWDYIPEGSKIPNGESCIWGDYHLTELCLLAESVLKNEYYTFFNGIK